jgi:hypothetical protein
VYSINRLNTPQILDLFNQHFTFIALKCTNEMPLNIVGKCPCFLDEFLDVILAEMTLTCGIGALDVLGGCTLIQRQDVQVRRKQFLLLREQRRGTK